MVIPKIRPMGIVWRNISAAPSQEARILLDHCGARFVTPAPRKGKSEARPLAGGFYLESNLGIGRENGEGIQLRELLVFLFLIIPSMAISFLAIRKGGMSFLPTAFATILRDLSLVALIAFFLWR